MMIEWFQEGTSLILENALQRTAINSYIYTILPIDIKVLMVKNFNQIAFF